RPAHRAAAVVRRRDVRGRSGAGLRAHPVLRRPRPRPPAAVVDRPDGAPRRRPARGSSRLGAGCRTGHRGRRRTRPVPARSPGARGGVRRVRTIAQEPRRSRRRAGQIGYEPRPPPAAPQASRAARSWSQAAGLAAASAHRRGLDLRPPHRLGRPGRWVIAHAGVLPAGRRAWLYRVGLIEEDVAMGEPARLAAAVSWLFVPASRPERFEKAMASGADAVVIDLEDAVPPADKPLAREKLTAHWPRPESGSGPELVVRVNDLRSAESAEDLAACRELAPTAVVLPKTESADDVRAAAEASGRSVLALVETARGLIGLPDIAA